MNLGTIGTVEIVLTSDSIKNYSFYFSDHYKKNKLKHEKRKF